MKRAFPVICSFPQGVSGQQCECDSLPSEWALALLHLLVLWGGFCILWCPSSPPKGALPHLAHGKQLSPLCLSSDRIHAHTRPHAPAHTRTQSTDKVTRCVERTAGEGTESDDGSVSLKGKDEQKYEGSQQSVLAQHEFREQQEPGIKSDKLRQGHWSEVKKKNPEKQLSYYVSWLETQKCLELKCLPFVFVLQSQNAYSFIWMASDLVSLAVVVGIFCFQKWVGTGCCRNPSRLMPFFSLSQMCHHMDTLGEINRAVKVYEEVARMRACTYEHTHTLSTEHRLCWVSQPTITTT